MTLRETMQKLEREVIVATLRKATGRARLGNAAKALGITRKCLWEKMRRYQINKELEQPQQQLPLESETVLATVEATAA